MAHTLLLLTLLLQSNVLAQTPGETSDVHHKLQTWKCSKTDGCVSQDTAIVIDSLSHSIHKVGDSSVSCDDGDNTPNAELCPDKETCATNCVIEGIVDYSTRGITTDRDILTLAMLSANGSVLSPRVYLLAPDEEKYEMLYLTGNEFSFDVDVSKLPCGMNGALYLDEMEEDGGKSTLNTAGPAYGTGYCDAQCYTRSFINGEGNVDGMGACCNELDIWEANVRATQIAPHPCNVTGLFGCTGDECASNGVCDKGGCSINSYRTNTTFYGPEATVDTSRPFTVVTQFPASDNGTLLAYRRRYIQDGAVIQDVEVSGYPNGMDQEYCAATGPAQYTQLGGTAGMGESMARGMVLAMSIWWDTSEGHMGWLNSDGAGPCSNNESDPTFIQQIQPDTRVLFSQIKWGEIDSTYSVSGGLNDTTSPGGNVNRRGYI
ncbi:Endoglucanase [Lachnellula suecica]|uniref:Glucanase n=1 Tax=Lachnellula suecica TaxID=602035 RepID=A0A8T9CGQ7_9HELO|nr:Endoglucanase [Lachnellula suecica]